MSGKYNRDITRRECGKCKKDCVVFKGTICTNELLDQCLEIKGEAKKINNRNIYHNLFLIAHN